MPFLTKGVNAEFLMDAGSGRRVVVGQPFRFAMPACVRHAALPVPRLTFRRRWHAAS